MKYFWPWLGISAFTVAHPVFNSDDRFTGTDNGFVWTDEPANTNIEQTNPSSWQDSRSPYHVFDVAAKQEKHTTEEPQPPMSVC